MRRSARASRYVVLGVAIALSACRRPAAVAPSNDLLIVGYDREPDTLNRFSTHILEDIQTCVVEGLTTTDEKMNVVPLLAERVPTLENGGVAVRSDGGMDVTWKIRSDVSWHDGVPLSAEDFVFGFQVINDADLPVEQMGQADIVDVRAPDARTLVMTWKSRIEELPTWTRAERMRTGSPGRSTSANSSWNSNVEKPRRSARM